MAEFAAKGTTMSWGGTTVTGITSIEPQNPENDSIDTTDLSDAAKTFIPSGAYDPGEVTIEVNHDPATAGIHNTLFDDLTTGTTRALSISFSDAETVAHSCSAFVQSFAPSGAVGDKLAATITFKCSGAVTPS